MSDEETDTVNHEFATRVVAYWYQQGLDDTEVRDGLMNEFGLSPDLATELVGRFHPTSVAA